MAGLAGGLACGCSSGFKRPNVLIVAVDTLRSDHCSVYGYERDTTPRLRAFAEQGVRFDQAYAPMGLTAPTHATLFTSLAPLRHGVVKNGLALGDEYTTLAEYLGVRGYQTAGIVSSFALAKKFGLGQGFSFYDDSFDPAEATTQVSEWEGHAVDEAFDRRGDHTTRRATDWLANRREPGRPFFLFVHYFDPHSPYAAPEPHRATFEAGLAEASPLDGIIARYDGEISFTDASIGVLLDALDEMSLAENTLVIVTADHGEGLMQRGYMLHGLSVHEEEVRVPLLVRWSGVVRGGRRISAPVELLDVMPTVVELTGFEPAEGLFGGRSLAPALVGGAPLEPHRPVHLQRRPFAPAMVRPVLLDTLEDGRKVPPVAVEGEQFALRRGRWKYILAPDEGSPQLYDLASDPGERANLAGDQPARTASLHSELERWIDAHRSGRPAPSALSERDRERLRALGYTD